jgi:hypothetical protein
MSSKTPAPSHPLKPLIISWLVHGLLLLVAAGMFGVMRQQVHSAEWIELMDMFGFARLIPLVQHAVDAISSWRGWIAVVGLGSSLVAAWSWWRPQWARWPLHVCAGIHLVLVPISAWYGHGMMGEEANGIGSIVVEVLSVIAVEVSLVIAIVAVERAHLKGSTPAPIP